MSDPANRGEMNSARVSWRMQDPMGAHTVDEGDTVILELAEAHGAALVSFYIPVDALSELLRPRLSISTELQLDGSVSLGPEFNSRPITRKKGIDLLQLVSRAVAPEMLEDEPEAKQQLTVLRQRLSDALALVDRTLASLDKPVT